MMEDAATAEVGRSQSWQWIQQGQVTADGTPVTREWVSGLVGEFMAELERTRGDRFDDAVAVFREVALADTFENFITVPAYSRYLVDAE